MLERLGGCFLAFYFFVSGSLTGPGDVLAAETPSEAKIELASLTPGTDPVDAMADLPRVLSDEDAARYRDIFSLQEDGDWKAADALIAALDNRVLMGHVLAQRYLHPTKYRSAYRELKDWMAHYADHPDAPRIHKLAVSRRPANAQPPKPPVGVGSGPNARSVGAPPAEARPPRKAMSAAERRKVAALERQIRGSLKGGWTLAAKRLIESDEVRKRFDAFEYDRAQAALANRYFVDGRTEWAHAWASRAAARSGRYLPDAHWIAGLAAWRLGRLDKAAHHFQAAAQSPNSSDWMVSAGAFWAARAHLVNRNPAEVNRLLAKAAVYPRTFYGLLARRILGMPTAFRWTVPPLEEAALEAVAATPAGQRALALIEVGEEERAEQDLRLLVSRNGSETARGVMALASRTGMPALAVRLNLALFPGGGGFDGAAFPIPRWTPESGFRVDRALVYALIRQESLFNPKATSWAGARGLMQLMPGTASFVAGDRHLRGSKRHHLYDPDLNLELGQSYIEILLNERHVGSDLFNLAAAWNGGPGNLGKWQRRNGDLDDPLLFIESIPSAETRNFIERVLANLWIYRDRLGQPNPSLDALASGERPLYVPLDPQPLEVAQNGEDNR